MTQSTVPQYINDIWIYDALACLLYGKHDDVIKWKHLSRYWPFVRGIHRSPVNSPHKGQWRGALMFSLICVWINGWVNNGEAGDLRRYRAHYYVTVMFGHCSEFHQCCACNHNSWKYVETIYGSMPAILRLFLVCIYVCILYMYVRFYDRPLLESWVFVCTCVSHHHEMSYMSTRPVALFIDMDWILSQHG